MSLLQTKSPSQGWTQWPTSGGRREIRVQVVTCTWSIVVWQCQVKVDTTRTRGSLSYPHTVDFSNKTQVFKAPLCIIARSQSWACKVYMDESASNAIIHRYTQKISWWKGGITKLMQALFTPPTKESMTEAYNVYYPIGVILCAALVSSIKRLDHFWIDIQVIQMWYWLVDLWSDDIINHNIFCDFSIRVRHPAA